MTRTLAQEVAELGIKVTCVEPGGIRTDFAGRSMTVTQRHIDDYEGAGHNAQRVMADHAGHEPGDPAKMAAAIVAIAGTEDPPLQLLLGADAIGYATQQMAQTQAELGRWVKLSLSTGFSET